MSAGGEPMPRDRYVKIALTDDEVKRIDREVEKQRKTYPTATRAGVVLAWVLERLGVKRAD